MQQQLADLGFESVIYPSNANYPGGFVAFKFIIPIGRFKAQEVEVALNAPHFPSIPPSGPYLKPHLLPMGVAGQHPFGGIHDRKVPNEQFQYWSRPFGDWSGSDKNIKTYIAFLRTLFDFE